jgi:chromosome partitioning protein
LDIINIVQTLDTNFDIIPSNILLGTLEQELTDEIGREMKLSDAITKVKDDYEYIIIDCPPSLGFLTINAIRASDNLIVTVEMSRYSMQGVEQLLDIVSLIRDRLNHEVGYKILVTMFDSRLRHSFSMLSKIREQFNGQLLDTIIHTNVKLKESAVMGQTVAAYDKYCRGSKDYFSLAKEVISSDKVVSEEANKVGDFHPLSNKMQELVKEEYADLFPIKFMLVAPDARSVYVTGSFNDWSLDETCRMSMEDGGKWTAELRLKPGTYKYQFIVDGRWQEDPLNSKQERNSFGAINSLIEVGVNED